MKKSILLLSLPALLTACQASETPADATAMNSVTAVDTAAEEKLIREQIEHWLQFVKAKDAAGIAGLYTEDGAVMPPNSPIGQGRNAIQQTWAAMMQTPGFDLTFVPEQIVMSTSGDMALDRGSYRLRMAPDGTEQTDTGKYVVVWRKVGGDWKAAADIFNSDLSASGR